MTKFNVQQKNTIDNYRSTHQLGFVVTDEYIAELIKKEMEQTGVIYAGFESLAKSVAKSHIKQPTSNANTNVKNNTQSMQAYAKRVCSGRWFTLFHQMSTSISGQQYYSGYSLSAVDYAEKFTISGLNSFPAGTRIRICGRRVD
jgi:hypothetical protein